MLKYVDTKVTFSEVPDEISLCINISGCPHRCVGCHSPYLQEDIGEELTTSKLEELIESNKGITCVCFMGGDNNVPYLTGLALFVKNNYALKTAWYSGLLWTPTDISRPTSQVFDYIKVGPYKEQFGPLTSRNTNQRMFAKGSVLGKTDRNPLSFYDITDKFWKEEEGNSGN